MAFLRFGGNITDDAGKRVKLLDPAGISDWPSTGTDARTDLLVIRIRRAMSAHTWRDSVLSLASVALVLISFRLLQPMINQVVPGTPSLVHLLILGALLQLVWYPMWRSRLHTNRERVASLILEDGLCPCCGYNFAGLGLVAPDPVALVICPECGSSWRRDRVERLEEFPRGVPVASPLRQVRKPLKTPSWSVRDDRGAVVSLTHPRLRVAYAEATTHAQRERLRNLQRDLARPRNWVRFITAGFLAVCGVTGPLLALGGTISPLAGVVIALLFIILAAAALLSNFAFMPRAVQQTLLASALCPSCVMDLSRTAASPRDGCTVCPACHAAWRLNAYRHSEPVPIDS